MQGVSSSPAALVRRAPGADFEPVLIVVGLGMVSMEDLCWERAVHYLYVQRIDPPAAAAADRRIASIW